MMRLRTDIWTAALIRRASGAGAFATLARRGASEAGAVFVVVDDLGGAFDLYAPAPQTVAAAADDQERRFVRILAGAKEIEIIERMDSEYRFDPDAWLVEIGDNQRRSFVEVVDF